MIDISKRDIRDFSDRIELSFKEDKSNLNKAIPRNFLRHEILKPWENRSPEVIASILKSSNYFKKSPFKSYDLFKAWLTSDKLSVKMIEKDLVYQLKNEFLDVYRAKVMTPNSAFDGDYKKGMRLFVDGLQKMGMNKASDANSTMRFTYGNVLSYKPADAVLLSGPH